MSDALPALTAGASRPRPDRTLPRSRSGAASAARLNADLKSALVTNASHPLIGTTRRDLTGRPYRFWRKGVYWIIYEIEAAHGHPRIVRVIDGRRDIARLLR